MEQQQQSKNSAEAYRGFLLQRRATLQTLLASDAEGVDLAAASDELDLVEYQLQLMDNPRPQSEEQQPPADTGTPDSSTPDSSTADSGTGKKNWFTESNRRLHFIGGIGVGFLFTLPAAIGCAAGMEFKDRQWGGRWDWLDFAATALGGLAGQLLQAGLIYFLLNVQ